MIVATNTAKPADLLIKSVKRTLHSAQKQPMHPIAALLHNNPDTVVMRGHSMAKAGIPDGSYVLIDKDLQPHNGDIIWCCYEGEWMVRFYERHGTQVTLYAAQPGMQAIRVVEPLTLAGVVIWAVKCLNSAAGF